MWSIFRWIAAIFLVAHEAGRILSLVTDPSSFIHLCYILLLHFYKLLGDHILKLVRSLSDFRNSDQINTGQSTEGQINTDHSSGDHMLFAKDLEIKHAENINVGDENQYWKCVPQRESRFKEALEALHVKVLCIKAKLKLDQLFPNTMYSAHLIFKTTPNSRGLDISQQAMVYSYGNENAKEVCLEPTEMTPRNRSIGLPVERSDGWMEVELGWFIRKHGVVGEVVVCLQETNVNNEKTGLVVAGVEVRCC